MMRKLLPEVCGNAGIKWGEGEKWRKRRDIWKS